jgi:phage gpG-like protein
VPRYAIRDEGITVEGLAAIQRALARTEEGAPPELRAKLKAIGEHVKAAAESRAPVGTGRTGPSGRLKSSIKISITRAGASVYSSAVYGGVQNVGGQVGRDHRTILKRGSVSGYMVKAVQSQKGFVEQETEALVEWLLHTFQEG